MTVRRSLPYMNIPRRPINDGPPRYDTEIDICPSLLVKNDGYIEVVKPIKRKFNVIDRKGK